LLSTSKNPSQISGGGCETCPFEPGNLCAMKNRWIVLLDGNQKSGGNAPVEGKVTYLPLFTGVLAPSQVGKLAGVLKHQRY